MNDTVPHWHTWPAGTSLVETGPCIIQTAAGLVGVGYVVLPRLPAGGLVPSPNWCPVGLQVLPQVNAVCRCHAQWPSFPSRTDGGGAPEPSAKLPGTPHPLPHQLLNHVDH